MIVLTPVSLFPSEYCVPKGYAPILSRVVPRYVCCECKVWVGGRVGELIWGLMGVRIVEVDVGVVVELLCRGIGLRLGDGCHSCFSDHVGKGPR